MSVVNSDREQARDWKSYQKAQVQIAGIAKLKVPRHFQLTKGWNAEPLHYFHRTPKHRISSNRTLCARVLVQAVMFETCGNT